MSQAVDDVIAQVSKTNTVLDSAVVFVKGVPGLIDAAVKEALAKGATAAELLPLTNLSGELKAKSDALEAALTANTPAPPSP